MIYFLQLFLISISWAEVQISTDLRENYLAGESIVIQITARNIGAKEIDVPDLGAQSWRTKFSLQQKGKGQQTRSNTKNTKTNRWKIPPRGARSVLLEIPSSAALEAGKYDLSIQIDAQAKQFEEKKTIHLATPSPLYVDTHRRTNQVLEALWMQRTSQGFDLYLNNGKWNQYLHSWTQVQRPKLLSCSDCQGKYHWQKGKEILLQGKTQYKISPPWPKFEVLHRGVMDNDGLVHFVLWIPQQKDGSLWLLSVDRKGLPSYRKMRVSASKPTSVNSLINTQQQALFIISYNRYAELFKVNKPPRNFPVPAQKIISLDSGSIIDADLVIHPEQGIATVITQQQNDAISFQWRSLNGSPIGKPQKITIEKSSEIIDIVSLPDKLLWLTKASGSRYTLINGEQLKTFTPSGSLRLHPAKHKPTEFSAGRWKLVK